MGVYWVAALALITSSGEEGRDLENSAGVHRQVKRMLRKLHFASLIDLITEELLKS